MKNTTLLVIVILFSIRATAQIDGTLLLGLTPVSNTDIATITSPPEGALFYNTDEKKIYLNTGSGFTGIPSLDSNSIDFWGALGSAGTDPSVNFLGTTDTQDFILKTNNTERLRLSSDGNIGINTATPDAQLDIESAGVPLRIQPSATTPTGTQGGQIFMGDDGILYAYDSNRNKWLSVDRTLIGWGRNSNQTTNEYLRQFNGSLSSDNGWRMIRDGTITAITAQTNSVTTWVLEIRKNDNPTSILTLDLNLEEGNHNNSVNVDVSEGDYIQAFCNGSLIENPQTLIEISWRK